MILIILIIALILSYVLDLDLLKFWSLVCIFTAIIMLPAARGFTNKQMREYEQYKTLIYAAKDSEILAKGQIALFSDVRKWNNWLSNTKTCNSVWLFDLYISDEVNTLAPIDIE